VASVIGGLLLCTCVGCVGFTVFAARTGGSATATPGQPVAAATSTIARTSAARTSTPTTRASTGSAAPAGSAATATPAPIVVSGCGGGTVSVGFNPQLRADLDQWNRIVDDANAATGGWNNFLTVTNDLSFTEASGNPQAIAAADAFLAVAQAELPTLRTEATSSGRFAQLAAQEIATIEAEVEFVTLYRKAIAESDSDTWNEAIDASAKVDTAREALEAEIDKQCDFWRSR
jgi:hypothetical protein